MGPRQQPAELPIGTLLAKRYTVVQKLGAGGFGAVYEADDALMNQRVAVKVMRTRGERDKQQFRAEVSLLRLLRLPNLVHLIDDGEFEGVQFLVTDVVRGARFPGLKRRPSWKDIEYTTLCLLESLARVHSYGVVHRDLKPSNVFVGADGEPTILDFGVSFGPGFRLDNSGRIVGTPAFLSPEQATGQPGDARSDLYALGVMVYEALSGRLPHTGDTLEQLLAAKINVPPVPLRNVAPHVPPGVAFAIDALLRTDVHLRPPNATIALELFGVPRNNLRLPWLGPREAIERAVALLVGGESFVTEGRSGLGHSRLLEEVAIAVEEAGGEAWVGGHAEYKWGSLPNELLERIERLPEVTDEDMVGLLRDAANDGVILLMDDAPLMDKQTRQAVHRSGIPTAWVSESADLPRVRLAPLSAEDVDVLFHGPELIVHLRSDAATLAVRLSEGRPRALSVQLDGWVKAGIGYWDHGKMRVTREALDRIDAGLDVVPPEADSKQLPPSFYATLAQQAGEDHEETMSQTAVDHLSHLHRTMLMSAPAAELSMPTTLRQSGDAVPTVRDDPHLEIAYSAQPGARGRLLRLIRAGAVDDVVEEALWLARDGRRDGNPRHAFASVREALALMRASGRRGAEPELLRELTLLALQLQGARERDLALYELEHGRDGNPLVEALSDLLQYVRLIRQGGMRDERGVIGTASRKLLRDDPDLQRWRQGIEVSEHIQRSPEAALRHADEFLGWAEQVRHAAASASANTARGLVLYSLRRFIEAAEHHEIAATLATSAQAAGISYCNAAGSWLEAGQRDKAMRSALKALEFSDAARLPYLGVSALWLQRAVSARFGAPPGHSAAVVELYDAMSDAPTVTANAWLVEASLAWRRNDLEHAKSHGLKAADAAAAAGVKQIELLSRCLASAAGAFDANLGSDLTERRLELLFPRVKAQAYALYLVSNPPKPWLLEELNDQLAIAETEAHGAPVWEVLTYAECAAQLAGAS